MTTIFTPISLIVVSCSDGILELWMDYATERAACCPPAISSLTKSTPRKEFPPPPLPYSIASACKIWMRNMFRAPRIGRLAAEVAMLNKTQRQTTLQTGTTNQSTPQTRIAPFFLSLQSKHFGLGLSRFVSCHIEDGYIAV